MMGGAQQIAYTNGAEIALFRNGRLLKTPILATYRECSLHPCKIRSC
jgi:hypothetical protein